MNRQERIGSIPRRKDGHKQEERWFIFSNRKKNKRIWLLMFAV